MAHPVIPSEYDDKQILVADDEREHIQFLLDYLEAKEFRVAFFENAKDALAASKRMRYRAYFIDLNIPFGDPALDPKTSATFTEYPGLYIIQEIRTQGNAGARVVAYSAHYNEQINSEIQKLYCKYIIKGRAKELKDAINEILKNDPLQQQSSSLG